MFDFAIGYNSPRFALRGFSVGGVSIRSLVGAKRGMWYNLRFMKLTARQIERLAKQGEVVHTECKDASGGLPDSLWESYSSFANTDGGVILLGVKEVDRKFSIAGVPKAATLTDYHGRRGIVIEKQAQTISFANPGIFRVNKAVAVEGGTSDARNSHIFNICALVDIGERSGMGLADLYGHWKKNGLPAPVITEEYDPDRVKITVYTDSDQDPTKTRPRPDQSTQNAPEVPQVGPRVPQKCPKSTPRVLQKCPRNLSLYITI